MKKQILVIILLVILVVSCLALTACEKTSKGIEYRISADGQSYVVDGIGLCEDVDIVIPEKYKGKKVTAIAEEAFANCKKLTSIVIPESVTSIGTKAFYECENLVNVTFPLELVEIGSEAFRGCKKLDGLSFAKGSKLTSIGNSAFSYCKFSNPNVTIPSNVTSIGENVFQGSNVHTITFGKDSKLTSIGDYAFSSCSLYEITIPASVTSIGFRAFYLSLEKLAFEENCQLSSIGEEAFLASRLKSVEIPSSITNIGKSAFNNCSDLERVEITDLTAWCNIDFADRASNPLFYARRLYLNGEELTNLAIPEGLTSIRKYSFDNCDSLINVTIPSGVTSIGDHAFNFCQNLTSVSIPATVKSIGYRAFMSCYSLENVVFEDNSQLETIGEQSFYTCHSLESITIPASVTTIGKSAFAVHYNVDNSGLKCIIFQEGSQLKNVGEYAFDSCYALEKVELGDLSFWYSIKFAHERSNPLYYAKHLYLDGEEVKDLVITVVANKAGIEAYAFYNCESLTSVTFSAGISYMYTAAFYGCVNLQTVTFEEGSQLQLISENAFYGCSSLISITIPKRTYRIDVGAFSGCVSLNSVTFQDPNGWYLSKTKWEEGGISLDLTNASKNATYLTSTYASYYWHGDYFDKWVEG